MKICAKCGKKVDSKLNKCNHCGYVFENNNEFNKEKGIRIVKNAVKGRSIVIQCVV